MKKFVIPSIFIFLGCLLGCAGTTQVSSLPSYNGLRIQHSDKCLVIKTSRAQKYSDIMKEYENLIMGDSHVEATRLYLDEEVAFDCMSVGAKSALVLDRGVIASELTSGYFSSGVAVYDNTRMSGYQVVYFIKSIPVGGRLITKEEYNTWMKKGERLHGLYLK